MFKNPVTLGSCEKKMKLSLVISNYINWKYKKKILNNVKKQGNKKTKEKDYWYLWLQEEEKVKKKIKIF